MSVFVMSVLVFCALGSVGSFGLVLAIYHSAGEEIGIPTDLPLVEEEAPLWVKVMNA